jgi:hypothetical protein
MPDFLSTLPPLALIVLLVFLFAVALVVALWSLLTLGMGPRSIGVVRVPRAKQVKKADLQPLPSNRFMRQQGMKQQGMKQQRMKQQVEEASEEDVASELPTNHVSRSRVKILKTLEPDPELETPAFKPTTYDQLVNRQRVPKTALPKANLPKTGLPTDALNTGLPKQAREIGAPKTPLREANRLEPTAVRTSQPPVPPPIQPPVVQPPLAVPPRVSAPAPRTDLEDTSTQPSLFEAGRAKRTPAKPAPQPQPPQQHNPVEPEPPLQKFQQVPRKPSVQREESEAAFRASQGSDTKKVDAQPKPKSQQEKDEAFNNFLRKNDDLGF